MTKHVCYSFSPTSFSNRPDDCCRRAGEEDVGEWSPVAGVPLVWTKSFIGVSHHHPARIAWASIISLVHIETALMVNVCWQFDVAGEKNEPRGYQSI
jgi:hypothetical protein